MESNMYLALCNIDKAIIIYYDDKIIVHSKLKKEVIEMAKELDVDVVRNEFIKYWISNGFVWVKPTSIIPSEYWVDTLFVNSGLIRYLEIVEREGYLYQSLTTCQPCIKLGSGKFSLDDMVLKDGYFTFFEQLTCGGGEDVPIAEFIKYIWVYLESIAGLPKDKIYVGVHSSQSEVMKSWIDAGISSKNIIFPDEEAFELDLQSGRIYGVYSPFYYDRGETHPLACKTAECNINCSCGRFLELGDVGIVYKGKARIIDHGIGLERITAIARNLEKVNDIEVFQEIASILRKEIGDKEELPVILMMVVDYIRSAVILLLSGIKPGNKGRAYVLRAILRKTFLLFSKMKVLDCERIRSIILDSSKIIKNSPLFSEVDQETITRELKDELQKYEELIMRGRKVIRKFLQKRRKNESLDEEEMRFLYETYGLPAEIVSDLLKDLS